MTFVRLLTLAVLVCALFGAPAALGTDESLVTPWSDGTPATGAFDGPAATPGFDGTASTGAFDGPAATDGSEGTPATGIQSSPADPEQPNIIVFFLDDLNPHDGRLWSDPSITPTMYDLFVANGVHFKNAITETPLCCPGRAGLLTGLHTHNHGVTYNDVRLFNPSEHIGRALKDVGYETMLIGKYFNHPNYLTAAQWATAAAGWTHLDAIRTASDPTFNYFYNYTLFTKQGNLAFTDQHSTRTITERAVAHLREASPSAPVFALLTPYDTHYPNLPLAEFDNDPRCSAMPPWLPPNYNEADVSDKPSYIRNRPLLPEIGGWPMVSLCEEMLGIDWMVTQVRDELQAQGRLDNTLFVFSADNGMGWGQHRSGKEKQTPYATQIPLYMNWPSRWGSDARTITDAVANIDLAPTFCDMAGCDLGPYGTGQTQPDGISLLPLLDGSVSGLNRQEVLEASYAKRFFSAVRLSPSNPLGYWHYVEYTNGERELYDLANDPWELENLALDPALADLRDELSGRIALLMAEGRVPSSAQRPDGSVAVAAVGTYKGRNIYGLIPKASQTQTLKPVLKNSVHDFSVRVTNHSSGPATFSVGGRSHGSANISTRYLVGGTDVTASVVAGTYMFADVQPGTSVDLVVRMVVGNAPLGAKRSAVITLGLPGQPTQIDVLKMVAVRGRPPAPPPPPPPTTTVIDLSAP